MAVTKTLTLARPYIKDSKVVKWDLQMKYEQGTEGEADYYTSDRRATVEASQIIGDNTVNNFTPKAEADWSKSDILALCPISSWDAIFAQQYDSVITNPSSEAAPDNDYVIPS